MEKLLELRNNTVVKKNSQGTDESRTRDQIARAILETGPATATALAKRLKVTPSGIRRHLDGLVGEGILEAREPHLRSLNSRGRGRPSKVFIITDNGREKFEHSYDDLAVSVLNFVSSQTGGGIVKGFAESRALEIERKANLTLLREKKKSKKKSTIDIVTDFLSSEGYAATSHDRGVGQEICQHHCPIAHVAAQFPQLCEAETAALSRILGTHVQRLATIAHGDGVCTTFVPSSNNAKNLTKKKIGARI